MYTETSRTRLSHAHVDLITLANELEKVFPNLQISCTRRNESDQTKAYSTGVSKAKFGQSPHNFIVSLAIDFVILKDGKACWTVSEYVKLVVKAKEIAKRLGIKIICGADFTSLKDYPHFEISNWKSISKTYSLYKG